MLADNLNVSNDPEKKKWNKIIIEVKKDLPSPLRFGAWAASNGSKKAKLSPQGKKSWGEEEKSNFFFFFLPAGSPLVSTEWKSDSYNKLILGPKKKRFYIARGGQKYKRMNVLHREEKVIEGVRDDNLPIFSRSARMI